MRRRRELCLSVITAALVGGCSLLTDLGGLAGPAETTPSEAGAPSSDAGSEASSDADAGSNTFCGQHPGHTWCEDFDTTDTLPPFDTRDDAKGCLSIDGTSASQPHSLRVRYPSGDPTTANVTKKLPTGDKISLSFDLRADYTFSAGKVIGIEILLPTSPDLEFHYLYLESYGDALRLIETTEPVKGSANYAGGDLASSSTRGRFYHFDITIDRTTSHCTLALDGQRLVDRDLLTGFPSGQTTVLLGGFGSNVQGGDGTFYIDNIVADAKN